MKVIEINICPDLSTGMLMRDIANQLNKNGDMCITASAPKYRDKRDCEYTIGTMFERHAHIVLGQIVGSEVSFSRLATLKLLRYIKQFEPDIIHLHNIHQYYLNYSMLMNYLRTYKGKIVWTFHDCWPFTGVCHHYTEEKCDKWQKKCYDCPYIKKKKWKPIVDLSTKQFCMKKNATKQINELYIVTPSEWLADEVKKSFLKNRPVTVISNGIDTDIFCYRGSSLKEKYGILEKKVVLGVASHWTENKGLHDFELLSELLGDKYQIVLIGVDADKRTNNKILYLPRTANKEELAQWYSSADVYCNLSTEETFGLVVAEAMACGTPVVVYDSTALPELVRETNSYICMPHDLTDVVQKIGLICTNGKDTYSKICREKVIRSYCNKDTAEKYINFYRSILESKND